MNEISFEEGRLSENLVELDCIAAEISNELDLIYKELDRNGKWKDFIVNLDKIQVRKNNRSFSNVIPENYYENIHFAFNIIEKYEELKSEVETTIAEANLLRGENLEKVEMPEEMLIYLKDLGISLDTGISNVPSLSNESTEEKICIFYLNSCRLLEFMGKALDILRGSRIYIFSQYR